MRVKKGQQEKEVIDVSKTFGNIAARNLAIETLKDGDLVKVLDASNDPLIKSGWAIYRFCFETQTFDLIEQEVNNSELSSLSGFKNEQLRVFNLPNLTVLKGCDLGIISLYPFKMRNKREIRTTRVGQVCRDKFDLLPDSGSGSLFLHIYTSNDHLGRTNTGLVIHRYENVVNLNKEIHHNDRYWVLYAIVRYDFINYNYTNHETLPIFRNSYENREFPMIMEYRRYGCLSFEDQFSFSCEDKYHNEGKGGRLLYLKRNGQNRIISSRDSRDIEQMRHGASFVFQNGINLNFNTKSNSINWNKRGEVVSFSHDTNNYNCNLIDYQITDELAKSKNINDVWFHYISCYAYLKENETLDVEWVLTSMAPEKRCLNKILLGSVFLSTSHNGIIYEKTKIGHTYRYGQDIPIVEIPTPKLDLKTKSFPNIDGRDVEKETLYNGQLIKVVDAKKDSQISKGWATYRYIASSKTFDLISCEFPKVELPEIETPTLDEVVKKGGTTGEKITIKRDSTNTTALAIEDLKGRKKHGFHMLNEAGQYELYNKLNQIGLSFDGEGNITALRRIKAKALAMTNNALKGRIASCVDGEGNFIWVDPTRHNAPDGFSCDYIVSDEAKYKFATPDAIKGFRSDMRLLKDFDFNIEFDYKTLKLSLVGLSNILNIPVRTKDGDYNIQIAPISFVMDSVNQGKTIYIPVFKQVHANITNDAYYLGNTSNQNGVQVFGDGTTETTQLIMQLKINVPTDWNNWKHSDVTIFKYWKKALGTFDELLDYRTANP